MRKLFATHKHSAGVGLPPEGWMKILSNDCVIDSAGKIRTFDEVDEYLRQVGVIQETQKL